MKFDHQTKQASFQKLQPNCYGGEFTVAPDTQGSVEDSGWLFVHDKSKNKKLPVYHRCAKIREPPVAKIMMPSRAMVFTVFGRLILGIDL